jgi:hypothetical protein
MLEYGIEPTYPVAGAFGVVRRHNGFKQGAPISGAALILSLPVFQRTERQITAGLDHPEFKLRLVGIETHSGGGIGTANATSTHFQPLVTIDLCGLDQAQGWSWTACPIGMSEQEVLGHGELPFGE